MIPLGNNVFALADEIDLLPTLLACNWSLMPNGYVKGSVDRQRTLLHCFVAKRMGLVWEETIDHKNRNRLDCRRENLRVATYTEQHLNKGLQSNNKSGHKCISWVEDRQKWCVHIRRNKVQKNVELFDSIEDALKARDKYLEEHGMTLEYTGGIGTNKADPEVPVEGSESSRSD